VNVNESIPCRWCGEPISAPKRNQKFCCREHRYLWHQGQRISPAKFDERVRAIVRDELGRIGIEPAPV